VRPACRASRRFHVAAGKAEEATWLATKDSDPAGDHAFGASLNRSVPREEVAAPRSDNRGRDSGCWGAESDHKVSTYVPSPARGRRKPSAVSWSNAETTVMRETPSSLTSVRVEGRRVPLGKVPAKI